MICFYLNLRPNLVVCESGTGSGAMSHCILRTIAPYGRLHTFEFNQARADVARREFATNGVSHLVTVHHRDVCGKEGGNEGGFLQPPASVDAIFLDLPEPWLAIPHAAYALKPNARIASYSPCMEQSQRAVQAMEQCGFHSIKTVEFRLKEHYVDDNVEYEGPPREKRPIPVPNPYLVGNQQPQSSSKSDDGEGNDAKDETSNQQNETKESEKAQQPPSEAAKSTTEEEGEPTKESTTSSNKRRKILVARPCLRMRGHTAFLTFATAGNRPYPKPESS